MFFPQLYLLHTNVGWEFALGVRDSCEGWGECGVGGERWGLGWEFATGSCK